MCSTWYHDSIVVKTVGGQKKCNFLSYVFDLKDEKLRDKK